MCMLGKINSLNKYMTEIKEKIIITTFFIILIYIFMLCEGISAPQPQDFVPLKANITVFDKNNQPMTEMEVRGVNHEYGFRAEGLTDSNGKVTLDVMPGTWSFYATPTHTGMWQHPGDGYLLVKLGESFTTSSKSINLTSTSTVTVNLVSSVFDFTARENYVGFVVEPYGKFFQIRASGVTSTTALTLYTNSGLNVRSYVTSPRSSGETLFFIQDSKPLISPFAIEVTPANSSLLEFDARGPSGYSTAYHIQLHTPALSWEWSPWIADLSVSTPRIRVSPKEYYMIRAVDAPDVSSTIYRVRFNPIKINPQAGVKHTFSIGGALSTPLIRTTPRAAASFSPCTQIMTYFEDSYHNVVNGVYILGGSELKPSIVVHQGMTTSPPFEVFGVLCAKLLQEFDHSQNPQYDINWNFGPWGSGNKTGDLYGQEERRMNIDETESLLSQAPRYNRELRQAQVSSYQDFAGAMQTIIGVPVDYKMGVISNICHAGFEDEVQHGYKLEIGIEFDRVTGWFPGDSFIDHESGHGRIHKPPCRFFAISFYGESYATLIGYKARSIIFGGEEYLKSLLGKHNLFLRHLHGTPLTSDGDYIESMQFITHYINTHYGWIPHRRMILEWTNAFRGIKSSLSSAGYYNIEQFAVVYSWLCGENLAPLFEAGGFSVPSSRINSGLAVIQTYINSISEIKIGVGINNVEAPQISIPIELLAKTSQNVSNIEFTVNYDSNKANVTSVYKRDLTDSAGWTLTSDTSIAGKAVVHLTGTSPISGIGSVAQINLALKPNANGIIDFTLTNCRANSVTVSHIDGSLNIPTTPIIAPFPNLPNATLTSSYSAVLWAVAGTPPYEWSVVEDALPPGLTLNSNTGEISGLCTTPGEYLFRINVSDNYGQFSHRWFTIVVRETTNTIK